MKPQENLEIENDQDRLLIEDASRKMLDAVLDLGANCWAAGARAWCVSRIFQGMEEVFATGDDPVRGMNELFDKATGFLRASIENGFNNIGSLRLANAAMSSDKIEHSAIENATGQHYGRLFREFSEDAFWVEPLSLLKTRLERNQIDFADLTPMSVLDAGCGGGRYTVAWKQLGAGSATGVDISAIGIASAEHRVKDAGLRGISFKHGSVFELPFPNRTFDIVFSNGVLHHTVNWRAGIRELLRVLKPGGFGWLYLVESPGGLFWATIEVLRALMQGADREYARLSLKLLGIPDNRIFYMLDHVMAPINIRLTPDEIVVELASAGATKIRRLTRGTDFDRIERIHAGEPYADVKYGVGENRFIFTRE